ncbi:hypothetical protein BJ741DRAFT_589862 [Chytriomyces cf. hyalinus JEL632]|nr:hypothetical protein BJ741DRAFT_589862 [Chytriomyces cf. hyalinus JEL632]
MHTASKLASSSMGAYKPFMTEYKLSFKDPTPFVTKNASTAKSSKKGMDAEDELSQHQKHQMAASIPSGKPDAGSAGGFLPSLPVGSNVVAVHQGKSNKVLWAPANFAPGNVDVTSTSLTLPGMMGASPNAVRVKFKRRRVLNPVEKSTSAGPKQRYNIISGAEIQGEAYSGYKEGRRAVIQTFAHIDLTTNARTPGYNIISNRDYLMD